METEFHSDAWAEYQDSMKWYQAKSVDAADRFEAAVNAALAKTALHPSQFPQTIGGCRYCNLKPFPFSIVFRVQDDILKILAVAHAKRQSNYWRRRV